MWLIYKILKGQKYDKNLYFYWVNFLLYFFIICCVYQIAYQLLLLVTIVRHKRKSVTQPFNPSKTPAVSVVICAKNETENLQKHLPYVLNQDYPDFEVILVDDGSDEPLNITHDRLTIVTIKKGEKKGLGKKHALRNGILAARNELVLLTDADCQPVSKNWITEMTGCITGEQKIVLGISPYKTASSILNGLIEYETAQTALQYIGFALLGNPYMSVGRNVLYDRNLLLQKKWTKEELSIASGDDDLAIQTLATQENTTVCLSKESHTISEPKKTWKDFIQQKMRHYESGSLYKLSHRILLGSYLTAKLFLYAFFLILLTTNAAVFCVIILLTYQISLTLISSILYNNSGINKQWPFAFLNDILYCIFTVTLGLRSRTKPVKNWK